MRFEQLEYFYSLVSLKTIQAVSEKFYTSPQVVSKAIKQLEEELRTTLFSRTRRGLTLTEDGIELYSHVEEILSHYHYIRDNFIEEKPAHTIQDLKILSAKGYFSYFSNLFKNIDMSSDTHRMNILMNVASVQEVKKMLYTKNDYDIIATVFSDEEYAAITKESFIHKNYILFTISREPAKLWLNKKNQWASQKTISLKQLKKIPLIRYNLAELAFDDYLKEVHNVKLYYPYNFTDINFAIDLAMENKGGFLAPEGYILNFFPVTLLKDLVPIDLEVEFYHQAVCLINKKKLDNPSFAAIVAELTDHKICP